MTSKHLIFIFKCLFICLILVQIFALSLNSRSRKRIAVLDFSANNTSESNAKIVRNAFEVVLYKTGSFDILERKQIDLILKEQGLQVSGCIDTSCAVEIGKILSADYVAIGSLDKFGDYLITVKILDIKEGKVLIADNERTSDENKILTSIDVLAKRMVHGEKNSDNASVIVNEENYPNYKKDSNDYPINNKDSYNKKEQMGFQFEEHRWGLYLNYSPFIKPIAGFSNYVEKGKGFSLGLDYKNFLINNFFSGIEIGYYNIPGNKKNWDFLKEDGNIRRIKIIPMLLTGFYRIILNEAIYLDILLAGGIARNKYYYNDYYDEETDKILWSFIIKGGGRLGIQLSNSLELHVNTEIANVIDNHSGGGMDFIMISLGVGYRL